MKDAKLIKALEDLCTGIKAHDKKSQNEAAKKWIDFSKKMASDKKS